jgi:hypothetical protein
MGRPTTFAGSKDFVRSDPPSWDERRTGDNVLIETSNLSRLEAEGVDAQLHGGHEALPTGLMVVTGTKA